MTYRTTEQADRDIAAIFANGMIQFGAAQAERYHVGLMNTLGLLAANPRMGRDCQRPARTLRVFGYRAHLSAYLLDADTVLIIRVLSGRQDWERALFSST